MINIRWRQMIFCMLFILLLLLSGNTGYATDNFFWSENEYLPDCGQSRDGARAIIGIEIDGKRMETELPTCEEARKNSVQVRVSGKYLHPVAGTGAAPFIENGRTMIPLRAVADAFDFQVSWEHHTQQITLGKDGRELILYVGKAEMLVDGKPVQLEGAVPLIRNNVTFLPVRQLAEILGIHVEWNGETRTATFGNQ